MDYAIEKTGDQWDVVLEDGDLVWVSSESEDPDEVAKAVAQRATYRVMTWLGESVYAVSVGLPYLQILGALDPIEGVAGLFANELISTEGVSSLEEFSYEEPRPDNDFTLDASGTIRVGDRTAGVGFTITP